MDRERSVEHAVGRLDEARLRELVVSAAHAHDDVARAVRLAGADKAERLALLRTAVDSGLRTRRYLDYWQSSAWAREAQPVVDSLAAEVRSAPTRELVELLQRAIGHVVKVILRADDSNGMIGDLASRLLGLHVAACAAGVAEPVRLARWLVRFGFEDQDFFTVDPVEYAAALGTIGMAEFRREANKRSGDSDTFAATYTAQRLAVLDDDIARVIELHGGDLSGAYQYGRVAEAMLEMGHVDDALDWARRGIAATNSWQTAKLCDLAADILTDRGDHTGVLDLRRAQHQRTPTAGTYALLKAAAIKANGWDAERDEARVALGSRDRGGLVDALLADGDNDGAWTLAITGEDWDPGESRWLQLAKTRDATDPAAAMNVYLRVADATLGTADRRAYSAAVRHLKAARRAAGAAGQQDAFATHIGALRQQHRRRPSLLAMLDKASLTGDTNASNSSAAHA